MLDFSKTAHRRRFRLPSGVKVLFLVIPWVFIAYGLAMFQDFMSFYNNSVSATAQVVFQQSSATPLDANEAEALIGQKGEFPIPSFLYEHENGRYFVGSALVDASRWLYYHGEFVDIRYNRILPDQAQPVTLFRFWWAPGLYILGGFMAFLSVLYAFYQSENPGARLFKRRRKKETLNLRRK